MHGAEPKSETIDKNMASSTGAARVMRTKAAIEKKAVKVSSTRTAVVRKNKVKDISPENETPAGCHSWWAF